MPCERKQPSKLYFHTHLVIVDYSFTPFLIQTESRLGSLGKASRWTLHPLHEALVCWLYFCLNSPLEWSIWFILSRLDAYSFVKHLKNDKRAWPGVIKRSDLEIILSFICCAFKVILTYEKLFFSKQISDGCCWRIFSLQNPCELFKGLSLWSMYGPVQENRLPIMIEAADCKGVEVSPLFVPTFNHYCKASSTASVTTAFTKYVEND